MRKTNKIHKASSGFTLIELLVTIAIIGLLATIILVSFGPIREQARDATIKANMNQLRLATEIFYSNNLTYANSNEGSDFIAASNSINSASPGNVVSACDANRYCMSANLATDEAKYWCIDSTGLMEEGTKTCVAANFACE